MENKLKKSVLNYSLNITIIILSIVCIYLGYSLISGAFSESNRNSNETTDTTKKRITNQPNLSIQIDLMNGTGENRIAAKFRDYLKDKGFDIVDMGNYKSNDIEKTLVVDKTGDISKAKRVAEALGISSRNVIQQINKSQFLDATVIIGKDYTQLKPFQDKQSK